MCFYVLKAHLIGCIARNMHFIMAICRKTLLFFSSELEVLWLSETTKRFNLGAFNLKNQRLSQPNIPSEKNV